MRDNLEKLLLDFTAKVCELRKKPPMFLETYIFSFSNERLWVKNDRGGNDTTYGIKKGKSGNREFKYLQKTSVVYNYFKQRDRIINRYQDLYEAKDDEVKFIEKQKKKGIIVPGTCFNAYSFDTFNME